MVSLHKSYLAVTINPAMPALKWHVVSALGFTTQQAVGTLTSLDVSQSFISVEKKGKDKPEDWLLCKALHV